MAGCSTHRESVTRGTFRCVTLLFTAHLRALALVRRDHADLLRLHPVPEQQAHHLFCRARLLPVNVAGAAAADLLGAALLVEHEAARGVRPGEGHVAAALRGGDAVLQAALVEGVARELGERGVHAVLHLQAQAARGLRGGASLDATSTATRCGAVLAGMDHLHG